MAWMARPAPAGYSPQTAAAEQHRQAIEQLRLQADQREADAARLRLQTELALRQLEATRTPVPVAPPLTAYEPYSAPCPRHNVYRRPWTKTRRASPRSTPG
ncbi:hypothetical protein V8F63_08395 [Brevundimonas sp. LF-1]|uniref:hypothetical protein n=1 Tax=Brevundimonas sp. LF-1 TaxID=3126100 RepID=UPI0030E4B9EC